MLSNIGFTELVLILVVALIILGPSKLPGVGRSLGQAIREFKKATDSITEEVTKAVTEDTAPSSGPPGARPGQASTDKPANNG